METVLQILAICMLGYILLISIAVTAIVVFFVLKSKEKSDVEPIIMDVVEEKANATMQRIDESAKELHNKIDKIKLSFDEIADSEQTIKELSDEITQLQENLKAERDYNGKLMLRIKELEAKVITKSDNSNDEEAAVREAYYKRKILDERKLRRGACKSIKLLLNTRGSNSVNFLLEQIENVIKILDEACETINEE